MNRGSSQVSIHARLDEIASMRPRFMNRGSVERARCWYVTVAASMRPRFMNRGSESYGGEP